MSWPSPTSYWACSKPWTTSTTWAMYTGKYKVHTGPGLFMQDCDMASNCVFRSVKASHVLISVDGQVCMSGLRSIISLIRHGQRARVVHDFPQYSIKVLPWLSPEVLQQVTPYNTLLLNYNTLVCFYRSTLVCVHVRICRDTTSGQTSTVLASQPVS